MWVLGFEPITMWLLGFEPITMWLLGFEPITTRSTTESSLLPQQLSLTEAFSSTGLSSSQITLVCVKLTKQTKKQKKQKNKKSNPTKPKQANKQLAICLDSLYSEFCPVDASEQNWLPLLHLDPTPQLTEAKLCLRLHL